MQAHETIRATVSAYRPTHTRTHDLPLSLAGVVNQDVVLFPVRSVRSNVLLLQRVDEAVLYVDVVS
jgi:hypothetical protein